MNRPDSLFLFSGGADSLCAVVEEVVSNQGKPVLLSHRPSGTTDHRQRRLQHLLTESLGEWEYPHVSIWAHRKGGDANDVSQRSRSFLFACLAAAVADSLEIRRIVLADNGVVNLNLPTNQQVIGAKSSRSTHPKFLDGMNSHDVASGRLPPTCLIALNRPTVVGRPLELKLQPAPLTEGEEQSFMKEDFKSLNRPGFDGDSYR